MAKKKPDEIVEPDTLNYPENKSKVDLANQKITYGDNDKWSRLGYSALKVAAAPAAVLGLAGFYYGSEGVKKAGAQMAQQSVKAMGVDFSSLKPIPEIPKAAENASEKILREAQEAERQAENYSKAAEIKEKLSGNYMTEAGPTTTRTPQRNSSIVFAGPPQTHFFPDLKSPIDTPMTSRKPSIVSPILSRKPSIMDLDTPMHSRKPSIASPMTSRKPSIASPEDIMYVEFPSKKKEVKSSKAKMLSLQRRGMKKIDVQTRKVIRKKTNGKKTNLKISF